MKISIRKVITVVTFLFISSALSAQTAGLGSWSVLSGKYTFNKHWNIYAEAQIRSQQMVHDFFYYEYKGGLGYNFKNNGSVLLAVGHYTTYQPTGEFTNPNVTEFRLWQQFVLNNNIGRVKLEHRYRVEQRFISTGYRNRFRYRINALLPFGHKVIEKKTLYASVYNEIFMADENPFFEQNRIFGGLGYQFDDHITVLGGFVNRWDNTVNHTQVTKNFLQLNLFFTIAEFKSGRERHPSALD
jgi:hypothetical protein